jgi:transcriptional activator of cad operon
MLRIGAWRVNPASGEISRNGETARLEARTMRLLVCLAERAGEVVSIDDLLNQVWPDVHVSSDSVYQAVASLRRLLGDDSKQPSYIETVPRLGYRMVAKVSPGTAEGGAQSGAAAAAASADAVVANVEAQRRGVGLRAGFAWMAMAAICLAVVIALLIHGGIGKKNRSASAAADAQAQNSIAVLPFLDLTEEMDHGPFADGMTEELIDRLSKIPGLRVTPPTSSFYFKGKQVPVLQIAKTLGVAYVLDGSVRKSGTWLRVDARLIRADNGYVVWSQSYDRPIANILAIQDDIAGKVTKALQASIEPGTGHG